MEIWRLIAVAVTLIAAAMTLALRRSWRTERELRDRVAGLDAQVTALHRALREQQSARRDLAHRSVHDPLTGLPNRSVFTERLGEALPDAGLLLIDLDGFTDTNDALGPDIGDEVLVEVARRIRSTVRHVDTVARLGNDEFAVLMPGASQQRAQLSAVRVMDALRPAYTFNGNRIRLTASVGMLAAGGHRTAAEALRDADLALSAARAGGRDRLAEFQPELRESRLRTARMAAGLRQALDGDELTLHYQPVVSLTTGAPVAVEALARWRPGGGDPIPPAHFIPVAEQTGLVVPLGARVLREACGTGRRWYERYGTSIGVNISGRQLLEPDFADYVLAVLGDTGLPGEALILEITETVMVAATGPDGQAATSRLDRLRAHGVRVAIDDFGTGYSSLSYLHRLPIDILKIDSEFVRALDEAAQAGGGTQRGAGPSVPRGGARGRTARGTQRGEPDRGATFAQAILRLGMSLHLLTIAEGVETEEQADLLRSMGCPLAQGFLFARPTEAETAEGYLATHKERIPA